MLMMLMRIKPEKAKAESDLNHRKLNGLTSKAVLKFRITVII